MRKDDTRHVNYMISMINLCGPLVQGSLERDSAMDSTMSAMHTLQAHWDNQN